ncbi:MAG: hypothetical protein IPI68_10040 [Chitinophagaceae bacterium]|nr:hypothetical protein [Chitinophagaceae bacterium]
MSFAREAKDLAEKIHYEKGAAEALRNLGLINELYKKDWNTAIAYYKDAIAIVEKNKLYKELHDYYSCILNSYFNIGDYQQWRGYMELW